MEPAGSSDSPAAPRNAAVRQATITEMLTGSPDTSTPRVPRASVKRIAAARQNAYAESTDDDATDEEGSPSQTPYKRVKTKGASPDEGQKMAATLKNAQRLVNRHVSASAGAGSNSGSEDGPCAGTIVSVDMINFMCHRKFHIDFVRDPCLALKRALACERWSDVLLRCPLTPFLAAPQHDVHRGRERQWQECSVCSHSGV